MNDSDIFKIPLTRKSSRRLSLTAGFELPKFFFSVSFLQRKRKYNKENDNDDNISVQSLDVNQPVSTRKKPKRSLLRVSASLINLVSPSRTKQQESNPACGFKLPSSPLRPALAGAGPPSPYRPPRPSPAKRRIQRTWAETLGSDLAVGGGGKQGMSHREIKRQEAIYELYQGEKDIWEDLYNITKFYRDPLLTLGLITPQESDAIFGNINSLLPVHEELINRLQEQRKPDGRTENVGQHIHRWVDRLSVYIQFCANQLTARAVLEERKKEPAVDDFLQRCIASPFSRKLDLWTLLDGARGRFMKYPLLIQAILKYTQADSDDAYHIEKSLECLEKIIRRADEETGSARCKQSKASLTYLFDEQRIPEIEESTALLCSGSMKNSKGSKLHVFLYDRCCVVTRPCQREGSQMFQVYRQPIPASQLVVADLPDGEIRFGSFRSAFTQGDKTVKNVIRVSFRDGEQGQSHTLVASDEHDKRQWMQAFLKVAPLTQQGADN